MHRPIHALGRSRWLGLRFLAVLSAFALSALPAWSQDGLPRIHAGETAASWLSEFRGGILWHDPSWLGGRESGLDINGELLFVTPVPRSWTENLPPVLRWLATPRPHLGFTANTAGNTSYGYFGVTGSALLARDLFRPGDGIRFDLFGGGAVHDGLRNTNLPDRKALGSSLLFRGGAEIGYQFTPRYSVSIFYDHMSNGGLSRVNEGLNTVGLRLGLGF